MRRADRRTQATTGHRTTPRRLARRTAKRLQTKRPTQSIRNRSDTDKNIHDDDDDNNDNNNSATPSRPRRDDRERVAQLLDQGVESHEWRVRAHPARPYGQRPGVGVAGRCERRPARERLTRLDVARVARHIKLFSFFFRLDENVN